MSEQPSYMLPHKWWALIQDGVVIEKFMISAGFVEKILANEVVDVTTQQMTSPNEIEVGDLYQDGTFTKPE